jgi:hypothetical protein
MLVARIVQPGSKRILAIANADDGMLLVKGSSFTYAEFGDAIYSISNTDPVSDPTTGIDSLNNLVKPAGYVMTNSKDYLVQVQPGVTSGHSMDPSHPNHISIDLQRTVAKVTVYQDADASLTTTDGSATLSDLKYCITNVNRSLYLFQNYNSSDVLITPEYIPTQDVDPLTGNYYYRFYNYLEGLTDLSATKAMYITENNPSSKRRGNTTFIAIEAVFIPKKGNFTKDISYNEVSETFTVTLSETDLETASDIYKFIPTYVFGINPGTLLGGVDAVKLARKVVYHIFHSTIPPKASLDDPAYAAITDSDIAVYFDKYTDGKCYYRLGIGNQTNVDQVDYTVIRNHHYKAKITKYDRIGVCEKRMLIESVEDYSGPETFITASFNVVDWAVDDINY